MTMSSYEKTVWPAVLHCERVMNVIKIYNVCNKKVFMLDFFVEKRLSMLYVCVLDCAAYLKISFVCVCIFKMDTFC